MPKTTPVERVEKKKKQLNQKKNALLKKALTRFKFKDTCFCPQKRNKLLTNVRFMAPRKPNSAVRKIFWSTFANPFWSKDFLYLPGEGLKTESGKVHQGLSYHVWILTRNGLTKDLRGLKYKIMHGAQVKKFKFYGLLYKKNARSKYGVKRSTQYKWKRKQIHKIKKKGNPVFFRQERHITNWFYE